MSVPAAVDPAPAAVETGAGRARPRRVTLLGATGSIGTSAVSVLVERPEDYVVEAVTAFGNAESLARVAKTVRARLAVIADRSAYEPLRAALSGTGIEAAAGPAAIEEAATRPADIVLAGIVGAAGLAPTLAAVRAGSRVALANKECLVCAGDVFMAEARRAGVEVLPVDSEHNAVFQALGGRPIEEVEEIILTGSGGPFRKWTKEAMRTARASDAINHPTWSMGPKISVDSATLMNKGLEVIEGYHLFAIPAERIKVLIHPPSIVHGMVSFRDGATIAQMGAPDMRMPIAYCLAWPARSRVAEQPLDLTALDRLTFSRPDTDRFPALKLARQALAEGGWATNILNAANEIAVAAFLAGSIGFLDIARIVEATLERAKVVRLDTSPTTIKEALALDRDGRRLAAELLATEDLGRG